MIKPIELLWRHKYDEEDNYLISQQFTIGWFEINPNEGAYFVPNTETDEYYWDYIVLFKNRKHTTWDVDCPKIETIEEAKQACQNYLQEIVKEITI